MGMATASALPDGRAERHRRVAARDLLTSEQLAELRERSLWRGIWLIAHAWIVIIGSVALVAWWPNPLTLVLAVLLIGSRQLGLAILMHDGAHGCFSRNQKLNMALSQWFCAYPDLCRHARLPALPPPAPRPHAAGGRPRPHPVEAVPDHQGELSPQVPARHHGAHRVRPAAGAVAQCAGPSGLAAGAAGDAFLGEARPAMRRQCRPVCAVRDGRRVVGLSVAVGAAAADLADGDHARAQHRRARRGGRCRRPAAQYAYDPCQLGGARVRGALLGELSPGASPVLLRALLQPAQAASTS